MKSTLLHFVLIAALSATAQVPRLSLYEEFTGENCPPCATYNPGLDSILAIPSNTPMVVTVKWQVPIPSAPYQTWSLYQTYKSDIDWRYKGWNGTSSSTIINPPSASGYGYPSQSNASSNITSGVNSAPSGRIDGQHQWSFGATSDHPFYVSTQMISAAQSNSAPFHIVLNKGWNVGQTALNATVQVVAATHFVATSALVFRLVMVEKTITFSVAPGSNGETTFHNVAIAAFPNLQSGTSLASTWKPGQSMTFTLHCPLPSYTRDKNEVDLVGFIQDDGNRKVQQAVRARECAPQTISIAPSKSSFCPGEQITLTASGASSFEWGNGYGTSAAIVVSPTATTSYFVKSTDPGGCENISAIELSDGTQTISANASVNTLCEGETTTLTATGATSYSWNTGHSGSPIVVNPTTANNTFFATSTDPNGCANSSEILLLEVDACTGLNHLKADESLFSLYPNPAAGTFYAYGSELSGSSLNIVNTLGQKVMEVTFSSQHLPLELSLPQGIYFYSVVKEDSVRFTGKIVVH